MSLHVFMLLCLQVSLHYSLNLIKFSKDLALILASPLNFNSSANFTFILNAVPTVLNLIVYELQIKHT